MLCVKSKRLIDYLWEKGWVPLYETEAGAYYHLSYDLNLHIENYYIREYCIPNKVARQ